MFSSAVGYQKRGWAVFPCENKGKRPACQHGVKDATTDKATLEALWAGRDGLNVGIATGEKSNFFVLDIDGERGAESLSNLEAIHGKLRRDTLTSQTGNGTHYLFRHHPGIKTTASKIAPGIDTRADGGYIVAPPSIHPSGRAYEWINPLEAIEQAPQWLIDLLLADAPTKRSESPLNIVQPVAPRLNLSTDLDANSAADLLAHISPDCDYDQWVQIGMAIKEAGLPFSIWDNWSSQGTKYVKGEMAHKWNSFKGRGITIASLIYLAKKAGWRPLAESYQAAIIQQRPTKIITCPHTGEFDPVTGEVTALDEWDVQSAPVAPAPPSTTARSITYIHASEITPSLESTEIVKGVFGAGQLSVVYGESNCGKTFFMTDLCFHVALGEEWRGRRVEQGTVVYVALEGSHGLRNRIAAFRRDRIMLDSDMPFIVVPSHVNLLDPKGNIDEFITVLQEISTKFGTIQMIVIDTLSRAIAGGDENTSQDMSAVIYHADKIRAATQAHVCFVHHSGKDKAKGARGHSSLRAAVDTEIEISRKENADYSTASFVKQRDIEMDKDINFKLKVVELGENQFGEPVTSCVVIPHEAGDAGHTSSATLTSSEQFLYDSILNALVANGQPRGTGVRGEQNTVTYTQVYADMVARGFKNVLPNTDTITEAEATEAIKKATNTTRLSLQKKGKISSNRSLVWAVV